MAFWNAIEIVATKYYPAIPQGKSNGSISKTWESFKKLWGDCEDWPVIQGQVKWIDDNYKYPSDNCSWYTANRY